MRAALAQIANITVLVFAVSSMLTVGLAYSLGQILGPLRGARAIFRALVANFILVPLLAVGIERVVPLEPPLAVGLFLLAGSAGAPFLIKLTTAAKDDVALSAALLVLLVPATAVFLPFYVPLAMAHPSLSGLAYVRANFIAMGLPLLSTLILPLLLGVALRAVAPRWAARLISIGGTVSKVAVVLVIASTFGANFHELLRIVTSGAIVAGVVLTLGAFASGFLLSRRERRVVLGLGTAQRNVAAAMTVASRGFTDPDVMVMVTACVLAGLFMLFPIAWLFSRRRPHIGLPTPGAVPA